MTHRKQALTNLLEKVEAGNRTAFIDGFAANAFPPEHGVGHCTFHDVVKAYNGSLDAAKALHEAVLFGWTVDVGGPTTDDEWIVCVGDAEGYGEHPDNPARAWLIAIIKALIAMEKDNA